MILGNLVTCHNLSSKLKQIRGQTFYLFGRTHRLISELKFQQRQVDLNEPSYISASLALSKWSPIIIEMIKAQQMLGNNSDAFLKRCLSYNVYLTEAAEQSKSKANKSMIQKSHATLGAHSLLLEQDELTNRENVLNEISENIGSINNSSLHFITEQDNFKVGHLSLY